MTTINEKFQSLVHGTTHNIHGVAGTNQEIRKAIWEEFRTTFHDKVKIEVKGVVITLQANHSISGKSTGYIGTISKENYETILGSTFGLKKAKEPFITIELGDVYLNGGGNFYERLENKTITVL